MMFARLARFDEISRRQSQAPCDARILDKFFPETGEFGDVVSYPHVWLSRVAINKLISVGLNRKAKQDKDR